MADKDFKVKQGINIQSPLPLSMGGTGQTTSANALNAMLPIQNSNSGMFLYTDGTNVSWAAPSAYKTIQVNGTALTARQILNFVSGATVVDNSGNNRTDVTISTSGTAYQQVLLVQNITGMNIL